jgi:predicted nucleic acid-binding protein
MKDSIPSIWIDTNVFIDLYTDLRPVENEPIGGTPALEDARIMMQDAAWMAVALDEARATTISFLHEVRRILKCKAAPESERGAFVSTVVWIVKEYVAPNWNNMGTKIGDDVDHTTDECRKPSTTNDERDQIMVDQAKQHGLTVVTRDRGAKRRARDANVPYYSPAEYSARVISHADAKARFASRLEVGLATWFEQHKADPRAHAVCDDIRDFYGVVWEPPGYF